MTLFKEVSPAPINTQFFLPAPFKKVTKMSNAVQQKSQPDAIWQML